MAPQIPVPLARLIVRRTLRPVLTPRVPIGVQRRLLAGVAVTVLAPREARVETTRLGGRPCDVVTMPGVAADRIVLYLHGGGYTVASTRTHRALAAHLAATSGATVFALDYRLAPEHPHPAALDDALAAYRELLDRGSASLTVAGDSAGGGLALALTLRLAQEGLPAPAALGLISPWVDLSLDGVRDSDDDPLLTRDWLAWCARAYAGDAVDSPAVSPLLADDDALGALPPTLVQASEHEILRDDVERLVARLEAAGAPVTYRLLDGVWHVVHLQAGMLEPATRAVAQVGDFLRRHG